MVHNSSDLVGNYYHFMTIFVYICTSMINCIILCHMYLNVWMVWHLVEIQTTSIKIIWTNVNIFESLAWSWYWIVYKLLKRNNRFARLYLNIRKLFNRIMIFWINRTDVDFKLLFLEQIMFSTNIFGKF